MAAADGSIVSSDSHVTEPADPWEKRIDKRLRERAPGSDVARCIATMERLREPPVSVVHAGHEPSFGRDRLHELIDAYLAKRDG